MARRDELINAAGWAAAGAAILVASWRMDRLDSRGINPWSAPGLTPGLVGAAMLIFALLLAWSARRSAASPASPAEPGAWRRTLIALALCLAFGAGTLGSGLPFVAQSAAFVFAFTTIFGWSRWHRAGRLRSGLARAALVAVVASVLISWLFESVFLVRLP